MKGKHSRNDKKNKKKKKLRIVNKKKFIRSVTFCILFLILVGVIVFKVTTKNNVEPITNEMIDNMIESVETTNNITTSNNIQVTSRGSILPRAELKSPMVLETPETLYVNVNKGINVRDTYSTEGNKVKSLAYGTEVKVTAKMDNWGQIGEGQWILLDNVSATKPVIEEPKKEIKTNTNTSESKTNNVSTNENTGSWIKFTATGYCSCSKCCGKITGNTASGTKATAGRTVAMSSKYSFGTKVEIKGYGTYVVEDRGGAIKGNKIDIYFASHQDALNFGKKTVYLRVVN